MVAWYRGRPILGALPELRRDTLGTFERIAKLGDLVRISFPGRIAFLIANPDGIKHVFVDNHKNYAKQTRGYQMLRLALGEGLVTSEGEHWRRQRRIAQPAFHHQRIAAFAEIMTRACDQMLGRWKSGEVLEAHEAMMQVTLQIVGECLVSTDLSSESDTIGRAISFVLEETVRRVQNPLTLPLKFPTPANLRYRREVEKLDEMVFAIIRARRREPEKHNDLLAMFMEARDEETGEQMSELHLRDEVMTMVSAGHETTANALGWTFYLLSQNPDKAKSLRKELDGVLRGRIPKIDDLPKLAYTEAVIKESMRILPPVWMIARSVIEDDIVCGTRIPAGAMVFLSPWITHKDPRIWERPHDFLPERWLAPEIETMPKHAYFPFASGPRVCIGNSFAMMEAKLLLAMIASRFSLSLLPGHPVIPSPTVTLRPKHGLKMILQAVTS